MRSSRRCKPAPARAGSNSIRTICPCILPAGMTTPLPFMISLPSSLQAGIAAGKEIKAIVVDTRPRRFALTADGKQLWVSCEIAGVVNVIDTESLEVVATIEFLPKGMRKEMVTPVDLVMTKDGARGYVALG